MVESLDILKLISKEFTVIKISNDTYTTAEHDSLKIWPKSQYFSWFSQGVSGNYRKWLSFFYGLDNDAIDEFCDSNSDLKVNLQYKIVNILNNNDAVDFDLKNIYGAKLYHDYLKTRNINYSMFEKYNLEYSTGNILIPITDMFGNRIGAIFRNVNTQNKANRYKKYLIKTPPPLWPAHFLNNIKNKIALIFEGAWSVMRFDQVLGDKYPFLFVAMLGRFPTKKMLEMLNGIHNVIFVLDNDKDGISVGDAIKKLNRHWVSVLPNVYPDEMTDAQILTFISKSEVIQEKLRVLYDNKNLLQI